MKRIKIKQKPNKDYKILVGIILIFIFFLTTFYLINNYRYNHYLAYIDLLNNRTELFLLSAEAEEIYYLEEYQEVYTFLNKTEEDLSKLYNRFNFLSEIDKEILTTKIEIGFMKTEELRNLLTSLIIKQQEQRRDEIAYGKCSGYDRYFGVKCTLTSEEEAIAIEIPSSEIPK